LDANNTNEYLIKELENKKIIIIERIKIKEKIRRLKKDNI
jgi:hypothetical protein